MSMPPDQMVRDIAATSNGLAGPANAPDAGTANTKPAPSPTRTPAEWQQWARERVEYEDPMGYERGRRW